MKLQRIRRLDWYLGTLGSILLSPLARLLGALLGRDHTLTPPKEIVLIKLLGGGNFAIGLPAYLGLRERFPHVPLRLVTSTALVPFAEAIGIFDEIVAVDFRTPWTLLRSGVRAWRRAFGCDYLLDFEVHSKLVSCFTLFTCARNRFGFFCEDLFLRQHMYTHQIFFNPACDRGTLYSFVAAFAGAPPATGDRCRIHLRHALNAGASRPGTLSVGVGCSDLAKERMLSLAQWQMLLDEKLEKGDITELTFLGTIDDAPFSEHLTAALARKHPTVVVSNLCGKRSLADSLRMLATCEEFSGIDSALLHFARVLVRRVTSYWGPTDPARLLHPVGGLEETLHYRKIACSPCVHLADAPPCGGNNLCMQRLFDEDGVEASDALRNASLTPSEVAIRRRQRELAP